MNTRILPSAEGAYAYPLLIKQLLLSGPRYEPGREIVYRDLIRYDYQTLYKRICQLANILTEAGVRAGDTVAVMDWDSHRYLEAYFAVPMIGAVLHHVNIRLSLSQMIYTMDHAEDKLVLVHDDFLPLAEQFGDQIPSIQGFIQLTDAEPAPTKLKTLGEYENLLSAADTSYDFPDFDENSIATTFYTTGTTGNPKGVYFSHRQLVLHTLNMVSTLGCYEGMPLMRSEDVYMPMTPMFHVHAWGVPYAATMLGVKQVYPGRYEPDRLVQLYEKERVSFSHGVPAVLQMILGCEAGQTADLSRWKMLTGGSAPTLGLANMMVERGIQLFTAYGMSEACPLLTSTYLHADEFTLPLVQQMPLRVKTGIPISMVEMKLIDPSGNEVPQDGESLGEVVVRAPWLTQSYFKEPEKGAELWRGGWLHTGDVGSITPQGVLEVKDRIKDVIKTGGEWVSSLELENLISQSDQVDQVAVVGIPDEQWGERPFAMVVPKKDADLDTAWLSKHLMPFVEQGVLAKWAIPDRLSVVSEIPKTSVGKINKKLIREQVG